MPSIAVPFHLNEHRGMLDLPVEPDVVIDGPTPTGAAWSALTPLYDRLAEVIGSTDPDADDGPLTVFAGDCCAAVGVLAGLERRGVEPGVVWIDGHGDFNTPATTRSGYVGGMVLALITGRGDDDGVARRLGLTPLPDERVLLVDARDLDPAEDELIGASGLRRVDLGELDTVLLVSLPDGPLFLHVDLDVLDPSALPGLLFPAAGGADVDAVCRAVATVAATGRLAATSVACTWHPDEIDPAVCRDVVGAVLAAVERRPPSGQLPR